jgi:hypothetical protein
MRAPLYARVSTHDRWAAFIRIEAMISRLSDPGWNLASQVEVVGSGAKDRPSGRHC